MLQKSFTVDFLTKKSKTNEGEVPQYYVENSHPAIITPEIFELVQEEFNRRKSTGSYTSAINCFASRIVCGDCGGFYGRKVWHSNSKYSCTIWQCNKKFNKKELCTTPHLKEENIKKAFMEAFNSIIQNKEEIFASCDEVVIRIMDFTKQEKEKDKIDEECIGIVAGLEKLVAENARASIEQTEYNRRYGGFATRYNELQNRRQELISEIAMFRAKQNQIKAFLRELKKRENLLTEFDESLWSAILNDVVISSKHEVVFQFKDGSKLPWRIE